MILRPKIILSNSIPRPAPIFRPFPFPATLRFNTIMADAITSSEADSKGQQVSFPAYRCKQTC